MGSRVADRNYGRDDAGKCWDSGNEIFLPTEQCAYSTHKIRYSITANFHTQGYY